MKQIILSSLYLSVRAEICGRDLKCNFELRFLTHLFSQKVRLSNQTICSHNVFSQFGKALLEQFIPKNEYKIRFLSALFKLLQFNFQLFNDCNSIFSIHRKQRSIKYFKYATIFYYLQTEYWRKKNSGCKMFMKIGILWLLTLS